MRTIVFRLVTYVPAMLLAMVLLVLALSTAQAQQSQANPGAANPFAEPARPQVLDAPLPAAGRAVNLPAPMPVEAAVNLDGLTVEFIVGEQAVLRMLGQNGQPNQGGRTYHVYNGEPVLISGRKFNVEVVREQVRLYDTETRRKTKRGEIAWSGSVGGYESANMIVAGSGAGGANAQTMFAGTNLPSPSIKAVSSSVQYGAPGLVGGAGGMGGIGGIQGNVATPVQR